MAIAARSVFIFVAVSAAVAAAVAGDEDPLIRQVVGGDDLLGAEHHHFTAFLQRFGKSYADPEEHAYRFSVFQSNVRRARRHQRLDPSAVHGVTQFSDLTPEEFEAKYLGLRPAAFPADAHAAPILPTNDLPEEFDWRDRGAVGPVKNQVFFKKMKFLNLFLILSIPELKVFFRVKKFTPLRLCSRDLSEF